MSDWPFGDLKQHHYRTVIADFPWPMATNSAKNPGRNVRRHYKTIPFNELKEMPVRQLGHPDGCRYLIWTTLPYLERTMTLIRVWGLHYSTMRVWVKLWEKEAGMFIYPSSLAVGTGYEVRGNAELLLICKTGSPRRVSSNVMPHAAFFDNRREHSRKPSFIYTEAEQIYDGPFAELYSRERRNGWDQFGDEPDKFTGGTDERTSAPVVDGEAAASRGADHRGVRRTSGEAGGEGSVGGRLL